MGDFSGNRPFSEKGARRTLRKALVAYGHPHWWADDASLFPDDGSGEESTLATSWAFWWGESSTSYIHHAHSCQPDGRWNPLVVEWCVDPAEWCEPESDDDGEDPDCE